MKKTLLLIIFFMVSVLCLNAQTDQRSFTNFGNTINNSFFFVIDIIGNIQETFIQKAKAIGKVVLSIAILSAALNYFLTGTGLKDNIIKISKATLFFIIVIFAYPSIIGFISSFSFGLARDSVYSPVKNYFYRTLQTVGNSIVISGTDENRSISRESVGLTYVLRDSENILDGMETTKTAGNIRYTVVAPASLIKVLFLMAEECFNFADKKDGMLNFPDFGRILKGLLCAFFVIFTGAFALLEYIVCLLEFFLVASVGIILFPLTIWEGSKFAAESFVKAIFGFFVKLLFCNVAIFLLIYGFVSLFYILNKNGFSGTTDQIIFIIFSCLMFFFICKSAPSMAQSLLTGTPSLTGAGAIGAVGAAVGAAAAVGGAVGGAAKKAAGAAVGGGADAVGSLKEAGAAAGAVKSAGGSKMQQAGAAMKSIGSDVKDKLAAGGHGLARSLLGGNASGGGGGAGGKVSDQRLWSNDLKDRLNNGSETPLKDHFAARKEEGAKRGNAYAEKAGLTPPKNSPKP